MAAMGQQDDGHHHEVLRLPSVTQAVAEAGKAVAVADMNSEGQNEMMETSPKMLLHADEDYLAKEIQRALLDIQEKLAKKKNKKTDEDILLQLKAMSNRLDQGGHDETNEIHRGESAAIEACLDTNDTTMVESGIKPAADTSATNSMTIQAETLRQIVKDFSDSMGSEPAIQEHMPMVGSDKLLIQPADPSSTDSMTRLGQYSLQDDEVAKEMSEFWDSMSSTPATQEHTPVVGSDTSLLIKPADPSIATDSIHYSVQVDIAHDEMAKESADEETADKEAKKFADYRRSWEALWSETCGSFEHMTPLSSMHFTYYTPGRNPPYSSACTPETLQIFSIKLADIAGGLGWPLSVYGVVAVRDVVDHNHNFLFYCARDDSQELTQNDPFLCLIGPSRAVVFTDTVHFEIKLQVKGTTRSQDKALITEGRSCRNIFGNRASTVRFENCYCKMELCVQPVRRTTQATILGVQVANIEKWPFKYGARVACSSLPGKIHVTEDSRVTFVTYPASGELVMVDTKDGAKLKGGYGYLHLSRNVVSVEDQGRLDVDIQAYSKSGDIAAQGLVSFSAKFSKITRKKCSLGGVMVVITVAWSRVATDKRDVLSESAYV